MQALLPNDRAFDPYDILANVVGSALALLACSWYHKRMLERRRKTKHYDIVPGEDQDDLEDPERDVELGPVGEQETGVVAAGATGQATAGAGDTDVTEELDHWDENAEDWDDGPAEGGKSAAADDITDYKKRAD